MKTTTLEIEGMTCQHCVKAVKTALSRVAGVERVQSVDLDTGRAKVEITANAPNQISTALIEAVKEEGYDARVTP